MEQQGQQSMGRICPRGASYYVWQQGDTLQNVAQGNGISTSALEDYNPSIDFGTISVGTEICLPAQVIIQPDVNDMGPVLDGTGMDNNTVTPQPVVPMRPTMVCPVGYNARRVQAGQTYADLLVDLNVSYKAMRNANPTLRPGFMVAGTPYCAPPAGTRETCSAARSYAIQDGDTLAIIAQRLNTTQGRLLMLNPTLVPTDFSNVGVVICIG